MASPSHAWVSQCGCREPVVGFLNISHNLWPRKGNSGGARVPPRITGGNGRCLDRSKGTSCQRGPSPTEMTIPRANIVEVGLLPLDMDQAPACFLSTSFTPLLLFRLPSSIIHSEDKPANVHSSTAQRAEINQATAGGQFPACRLHQYRLVRPSAELTGIE